MRDDRSRPNRGGSPSQEKNLEDLWPGYLKAGYFLTGSDLIPDLVCRAKVEPMVREMGYASPQLTNHQLRRFFQHARAIEARLKSRSKWSSEVAEFKKLDVAAADAFGKSPRKIPKLFHDFVRRNVETVKSQDDFLKGFLPHFEALVGFGAQYLRDRERS
jgi:CRISPR type III-A-associated protein Csm2